MSNSKQEPNPETRIAADGTFVAAVWKQALSNLAGSYQMAQQAVKFDMAGHDACRQDAEARMAAFSIAAERMIVMMADRAGIPSASFDKVICEARRECQGIQFDARWKNQCLRHCGW